MDKLEQMRVAVARLNEAADAYYNGRAELMTDFEWDALFDKVKALEAETGVILPDSPTNRVSADTTAGEKEAHEYPALSLAKTKQVSEVAKWAEGRPIWISWKLDGLTLVVTYDNGKLTKVVTRGDGHVGTNITHLAAGIQGIPPRVKDTGHLVVRGEAVISYADFEAFCATTDDEYANPRNLASGSLTLKSVEELKPRRLQWIPFTLVHADNDNDKRYWMASQQYYTKTTEETDPFPYKRQLDDDTWSVLDSLTNNSVPTATVYNANTDNGLYLNRGLQAITQNDDGTMSFRYDAVSEKYVAVDTTMTDKPDLTGAVFYESFDKCIGTGGNDGVFKGSSDVASADFVPDNGGWDSMVMKGGARCAKFGNASYDGIVTSPSIMLTGDSLELCFKAAPWSRDDTDLTLSLSNGQLGQTTFEMAEGQWTTFTTTIMGEGPTQITFTPGRRFFLDEVVVRRSFTSGIKEIDNSQFTIDNSQFTIDNSQLKVYDLQGRPAASGTHGILLKRMADGRVVKVIGGK